MPVPAHGLDELAGEAGVGGVADHHTGYVGGDATGLEHCLALAPGGHHLVVAEGLTQVDRRVGIGANGIGGRSTGHDEGVVLHRLGGEDGPVHR